jgi:hypothetical protein
LQKRKIKMEEIFLGEGMEKIELYLGSNWPHTLSAWHAKSIPTSCTKPLSEVHVQVPGSKLRAA